MTPAQKEKRSRKAVRLLRDFREAFDKFHTRNHSETLYRLDVKVKDFLAVWDETKDKGAG